MLPTRLGSRPWVFTKSCRYPARRFSNGSPRAHAEATPGISVGDQHDDTGKEMKNDGWFFLDSVFPLRLGAWDFRHYLALFQEETLVGRIRDIFKDVNVHGFEILSVEPRMKDGGVFVKFRYTPASPLDPERNQALRSAPEAIDPALAAVEQSVLNNIAAKSGIPSWIAWKPGSLWKVLGRPWREDMRRYASPILRISFDGPDVSDERIWELLRPYGRIRDLVSPTPVPAGTLRSAIITFEHTTSSSIAHNCIYGAYVSPSINDPRTLTRLITAYERPIKPHLVRDWLTSHPRIVLPILAFLVGTLTYTVFDPIRAFAVQAKVMGWLDYREFALIKWLRRNALDRLTMRTSSSGKDTESSPGKGVWKDRREAVSAIDSYLSDFPSTIFFIHGPAGSGKSHLLGSMLKKSDRRALVIDCADIYSRGSDAAMVKSLAEQTGYRPIFSFMNSLNNLIDIASVGLIGQKAGLSSSLEDQVRRVLGVVSQGMRRASASCRNEAERRIADALNEKEKALADANRRERILHGVWHDGRVDCVAGNGIMSELGVGIESFGAYDEDLKSQNPSEDVKMLTKPEIDSKVQRERENKRAQDVGALPVIVIKNFGTHVKAGKVEVLAALAEWAADLVSNHIAHVVVMSDNRENVKRLTEALPTKPLLTVALTDADTASSLSYIDQRLKEASVDYNISDEEVRLIERLGGRASDLETIIHKVRGGQAVADAVEDIIQRGVAELRKNAFGDDLEDAKKLPWTRQQAWTVLKQFAQKDELQYYEVLLDFPFKGDENALREMEHAELISITTVDDRPSAIRPGKPIHRYVFQRLAADRVFQAVQDLACNELLIAGAESVIKSVESELAVLRDVLTGPGLSYRSATKVSQRTKYLAEKMQDALEKVTKLERENTGLRKVLSEGASEKEGQSRGSKGWVW